MYAGTENNIEVLTFTEGDIDRITTYACAFAEGSCEVCDCGIGRRWVVCGVGSRVGSSSKQLGSYFLTAGLRRRG